MSAKRQNELQGKINYESPFFDFKTREDLPSKGGRGGLYAKLSVYPEIQKTLQIIKRDGAAPFESPLSMDMDKLPPKDKQILGKQKNLGLSFFIHMRSLLKKYKLTDQVELRRTGNRVFLVGKE